MSAEPSGRTPMGTVLRGLNRLAGAPLIDRFGLRRATERAVYHGARSGYRAAHQVGGRFERRPAVGAPLRPTSAPSGGLFDLTPTPEQQMMVDVVAELATRVLRPSAETADTTDETPPEVLRRSNELGLGLVGVAAELGGLAETRSAVTGTLVAEALAHGDMALAVAALAPGSGATAISLWGDSGQQQTYLPSFVGSDPPVCALAIAEPHALFDPFTLRTTATASGDGFVLSGTKSAVVRAVDAELFVVAAARADDEPALFLVEATSPGLSIEPDPGMGLRAAGLCRLVLDDVVVGQEAILAHTGESYRECIRLSRLAWCALSLGGAQAVLDYVTGYVKQRHAFGAPIAHRQSVAFKVADMAIELDGMRLATYRAASRVDHGLPYAREAALASNLCRRYAMTIGTDGVQLLGGHGYVREHPVERWYRDLRAVAVMDGGLLV